MEKEIIFDEEFQRKLKAFYSFDEGDARNPEKFIKMGGSNNIGYRRTGRSTILAKILLETAIESGRPLVISDHYLDLRGQESANYHLARTIESVARDLRSMNVDVVLRFDNRMRSFSAHIESGKHFYDIVKTNPFPVSKIKERIKVLKRRKLLLLN